MTLYNLRSTELGHTITKFDDDLNVESSYDINTDENGNLHCHCPAGNRLTCRHRQMYHDLLDRVDSPWFLDFDTGAWVDPTGEARRENEQAEAEDDIIRCVDPTIPHVDPQDRGPQGSLGQPSRVTFIEGEMGKQAEEIITQPDGHPFRRRL